MESAGAEVNSEYLYSQFGDKCNEIIKIYEPIVKVDEVKVNQNNNTILQTEEINIELDMKKEIKIEVENFSSNQSDNIENEQKYTEIENNEITNKIKEEMPDENIEKSAIENIEINHNQTVIKIEKITVENKSEELEQDHTSEKRNSISGSEDLNNPREENPEEIDNNNKMMGEANTDPNQSENGKNNEKVNIENSIGNNLNEIVIKSEPELENENIDSNQTENNENKINPDETVIKLEPGSRKKNLYANLKPRDVWKNVEEPNKTSIPKPKVLKDKRAKPNDNKAWENLIRKYVFLYMKKITAQQVPKTLTEGRETPLMNVLRNANILQNSAKFLALQNAAYSFALIMLKTNNPEIFKKLEIQCRRHTNKCFLSQYAKNLSKISAQISSNNRICKAEAMNVSTNKKNVIKQKCHLDDNVRTKAMQLSKMQENGLHLIESGVIQEISGQISACVQIAKARAREYSGESGGENTMKLQNTSNYEGSPVLKKLATSKHSSSSDIKKSSAAQVIVNCSKSLIDNKIEENPSAEKQKEIQSGASFRISALMNENKPDCSCSTQSMQKEIGSSFRISALIGLNTEKKCHIETKTENLPEKQIGASYRISALMAERKTEDQHMTPTGSDFRVSTPITKYTENECNSESPAETSTEAYSGDSFRISSLIAKNETEKLSNEPEDVEKKCNTKAQSDFDVVTIIAKNKLIELAEIIKRTNYTTYTRNKSHLPVAPITSEACGVSSKPVEKTEGDNILSTKEQSSTATTAGELKSTQVHETATSNTPLIRNEAMTSIAANCKRRRRSALATFSTTSDSDTEHVEKKPKMERMKKNKRPKLATDDGVSERIDIGPNGTSISRKAWNTINWTLSGPAITRKILMEVFDRKILAFHTLTGKPSPAFIDCDMPKKSQLDSKKVEDITHFMTTFFDITVREVRSAITTKCADENKMHRQRQQKKK